MGMAFEYFGDGLGQRRQVLLWAVAARRQMDRWEPLVARHLWSTYDQGEPMPPDQIWMGEVEHHFAVVAFDHMLEALKIWPTPVEIPYLIAREVAEVRDLLEHWQDNMPVFNVRPRRQDAPRRSGKSFAARNPKMTPYDWFAWNSRRGAKLTANVSAPEARDAIRAVEAAVLAEDADLARFIPPDAPSPWFVSESGDWWPAQAKDL